MHPTLLKFAVYEQQLSFHAYPTMLAVAFLVGTLLTVRDANRLDPPIPGTPQGGVWAFLSALVGAKVFWILQYSEPKYLWHMFFVWEGGLVYYGGLIGGAVGLLAYIKINKFPVLRGGDVCMPFLALGQAITRVGCFLNGCCWGGVTTVPWGIQFPKNSNPYAAQVGKDLIDHSAPVALPVHPTQLYMVFGLLLIFAALKFYSRHKCFDGAVIALYCLLYGSLRFVVEIFRHSTFGGDSTPSVLGMTVSQTMSLFLVVGALVAYSIMLSKRPVAEQFDPLAGEASPQEDVSPPEGGDE